MLIWTGPGGQCGCVMLGPVAGDSDRPPGGAANHPVTDDADARFTTAVAAGAPLQPVTEGGVRDQLEAEDVEV